MISTKNSPIEVNSTLYKPARFTSMATAS